MIMKINNWTKSIEDRVKWKEVERYQRFLTKKL